MSHSVFLRSAPALQNSITRNYSCRSLQNFFISKDILFRLVGVRQEKLGSVCFCKKGPLKQAVILEENQTKFKLKVCIDTAFRLPHLTPQLQFVDAPKVCTQVEIINALFALETNPGRMLPRSLILWATTQEALTISDCAFYIKEVIEKQKPLSSETLERRNRIHYRLLLHYVWDAKTAFRKLGENPAKHFAGTQLMHHAYNAGAITLEEISHYRRLTDLPKLDESEWKEIENINLKLIQFAPVD